MILLVGECAVGKTQLISKIVYGKFSSEYEKTIAFDFHAPLWEACGDEDYFNVIRSVYPRVSTICFVYDIGSYDTFQEVKKWLNGYAIRNDLKNRKMILVGAKLDRNVRCVTKHVAEKFAKENGMQFVETSARTGQGIKKLVQIIYSSELSSKYNENVTSDEKIYDDFVGATEKPLEQPLEDKRSFWDMFCCK